MSQTSETEEVKKEKITEYFKLIKLLEAENDSYLRLREKNNHTIKNLYTQIEKLCTPLRI